MTITTYFKSLCSLDRTKLSCQLQNILKTVKKLKRENRISDVILDSIAGIGTGLLLSPLTSFLFYRLNVISASTSLLEAFLIAITHSSLLFSVIYWLGSLETSKQDHQSSVLTQLSDLLTNSNEKVVTDCLLSNNLNFSKLQQDICPLRSLIVNVMIQCKVLPLSLLKSSKLSYIVDNDLYLVLMNNSTNTINFTKQNALSPLSIKSVYALKYYFKPKQMIGIIERYVSKKLSDSEVIFAIQQKLMPQILNAISSYKKERDIVILKHLEDIYAFFKKEMLHNKEMVCNNTDEDIVFSTLITPLLSMVSMDTYNEYISLNKADLTATDNLSEKMLSTIDAQYVSELDDIIINFSNNAEILAKAHELKRQLFKRIDN